MRVVVATTKQEHAHILQDMEENDSKMTEAARLLGRRGGKSGSAKQNEARRKNGRLGGRPRKPIEIKHYNPTDLARAMAKNPKLRVRLDLET